MTALLYAVACMLDSIVCLCVCVAKCVKCHLQLFQLKR